MIITAVVRLFVAVCAVAFVPLPAGAQSFIEPERSFVNFAPDAEKLPEALASFRPLIQPEPRLATCQRKVMDVPSVTRGLADEAHLLLGWCFEHAGAVREALDHYSRSLTLRAGSSLALYRRAQVKTTLGNYQEALVDLREAAWRSSVGTHEILVEMAALADKLNRPRSSLAYLTKAFELRPDYTPVLQALVQAHLRSMENAASPEEQRTRRSQAITALNTILVQHPDDRDAALLLSRLLNENSDPLFQADDIARAEALARGVTERSKYRDEDAVQTLFQSLILQKKRDAAEQLLTRAEAAIPGSSVLRELRAQLTIEQQAAEVGVKDEG